MPTDSADSAVDSKDRHVWPPWSGSFSLLRSGTHFWIDHLVIQALGKSAHIDLAEHAAELGERCVDFDAATARREFDDAGSVSSTYATESIPDLGPIEISGVAPNFEKRHVWSQRLKLQTQQLIAENSN